MYEPICKPNQILKGTGQVAVITGWTPKNAVAKHLDPSEYAAIGQLYSAARGITPLVRNLLANPHVRILVLMVDVTKEDRNNRSVAIFKDFLFQGFSQGKTDTGRDCWVVESKKGQGYIDLSIPKNFLDALRENVAIYEASSITDCIAKVKEANALYRIPQEPWCDPIILPEEEVAATTYPGARYGHRIEGKTIAETWVKLLHRIRTTGTIRPNQYGQWQELIDLVAVVVDEPENFYFPEPDYLPITKDFLKKYIPQIIEDAPYQEGVKYTYGQRMRSWFGKDQIEQVIQKLSEDINSSRAVISLWDGGTGNHRKPNGDGIRRYGRSPLSSDHDYEDPPCLNHIWVRVIDCELSLTATFRSNDMANAWVANAMGLRALQQYIRNAINTRTSHDLVLGPLIIVSQSAHIYGDTFDFVDEVLCEQYPKIANNRDYFDHAGNFVISHDTETITVEWLTPDSSEVVKVYKGKKALKLSLEIAQDCPAMSVENALYLGRKLQEAEFYLEIG